jgi:alpha-glucosidase
MLREQPDLNWRNPDLRRAMLDAMRFWFDRGVDGFRVDILWHMIKAADFRDNPPNPDWRPGMADMHKVLQIHSTDQPEVFEIAAAMRALADSCGDKVLVGEIYLPVERLMAYYGKAGEGVHLPFNFQLIDAPWDAAALHRMVTEYEAALPEGGWPNWVLGNHDRPRIASRVGEAQARVAAMLLLTMRGTPTIYYGDELGLADVAIPPDRVQDPRELREPGLGFGRDPVRTPMPWDGSANAGFTTGEPWLPLNSDWRARNVAAEAEDGGSMLSLYRDLMKLRRAHPALSLGAVRLLSAHGHVLAYERSRGDERIVIALNLSGEVQPFDLPEGNALLTTGGDYAPGQLAANQGVILEVAA